MYIKILFILVGSVLNSVHLCYYEVLNVNYVKWTGIIDGVNIGNYVSEYVRIAISSIIDPRKSCFAFIDAKTSLKLGATKTSSTCQQVGQELMK
ncbi:hypothetical protein ACJX0J_018413, partial [Zea mays]